MNIYGLPDSVVDLGYVYAIAFSNGTVKVGRTTNPTSRFTQHAEAASSFAVTVTGWWISVAHADYMRTERLAIEAAETMMTSGAQRSRVEYFHGIDYAELLGKLQRIDLTAVPRRIWPAVTSLRVGRAASPVRVSDDIPDDQVADHVRAALLASVPWLPLPIDVPIVGSDCGRAFGELIAAGRRRMGLDQDEFADRTQLSRSTVSRWERGLETNPLLDRIRRVTKAADVHMATATVALGMSTISRVIADPRRY